MTPHASRITKALAVLLATAACPPPALNRDTLTGEQLFKTPFPQSNARSCATCHVPEDNFTLKPAHVERLLASNPNDALFSAIDADDPTASPLTFEHLKKGLVRVWLTVPENVDLIDDTGEVVTPSDRRLFVWRGVPSIADVALTAPYQLDGRKLTLEDQAAGAVTDHAQAASAPQSELERLAAFMRGTFSSDRARTIAQHLANGGTAANAPDVEAQLVLTAQEQRGQQVYEAVCAACHGGANKATIVNRQIHDLSFPVIRADGTVLYSVPATNPPSLVLASQPNNEFVNVATATELYLALIGATEHTSFTKDVGFPNYRYRFYTDGTRANAVAELPPATTFLGGPGPGPGPGPDDGDGGVADAGAGPNFGIEVDDAGNPVVGPNFVPQFFSTDPGRAMVTASPHDFEAFDVPTLRGIATTAPYFHNNTAETLEDVVELYSDHLLSRYPSLTQPGEKEMDPDGDTGPEQALTRQQKDDLAAFLKKL